MPRLNRKALRKPFCADVAIAAHAIRVRTHYAIFAHEKFLRFSY